MRNLQGVHYLFYDRNNLKIYINIPLPVCRFDHRETYNCTFNSTMIGQKVIFLVVVFYKPSISFSDIDHQLTIVLFLT